MPTHSSTRRLCLRSAAFLAANSAAQLALAAESAAAARQTSGRDWNWLGTGAAIIAVAAAAALAWSIRKFYFRREQAMRNDPRQLLRELCQVHGLSRRAERLLRRAALELGTPHAGRLFLEHKLLLEAQKLEQLRGSKRALVLLYEQLFGEDA